MNIDDVKEIPDNITLDMVFAEQRRLMEKYKEIEGRSHELQNLDTREGQTVIKDFLWRITEEVGEALDSKLGLDHVREELADGLHFLIELCIVSDYETEIKTYMELAPLKQGAMDFQRQLGVLWIALAGVGRTCKNKPWKQTQVPLDRLEFYMRLIDLVREYFYFCGGYFISKEELYKFYFKKAQVNKFRQQSGY